MGRTSARVARRPGFHGKRPSPTNRLADELHLVVAPFFVGDSRASRVVGDGRFPWNPGRRATLAEVRPIGDVVLLRYALSPRCES